MYMREAVNANTVAYAAQLVQHTTRSDNEGFGVGKNKCMVISIDQIRDKTVKEAAELIKARPRKRLGDLRIFDLILVDDKEHQHVHGVYFFFSGSGNCLLYVGRVQSPQFIERIPAHFAIGEGSWQNRFLKSHREEAGLGSLAAAAADSANCEILLLLAPPEFAAVLEALWIRQLKPKYNKRKPSMPFGGAFTPDWTINEILQGTRAIPGVEAGAVGNGGLAAPRGNSEVNGAPPQVS
jgi:hypothetical protein